MEQKANDFLEKQPIGSLMKKYAVRDMHNLVKNMTYYTTNTAADAKWRPAYHG